MSNTHVATFEDRHRWVTLLSEAAELARQIQGTSFVPKALRGDQAAITAAILYGDEVGLPPMQALAKIAVIDGKPTIAAEAQRALIQAAGHDIWPEDFTTSRVTWAGRRKGSDVVSRATWTLDDAKRAGLAGKPNWRTYPRPMLSARASAELARAIFADVIGGLAATEEIEDGADMEAPDQSSTEPPDATTQPKPTSRRKRADRPTPPVTTPTITGPPPADDQVPLDDDQPAQKNKPTDAQMRLLFHLFSERGMADRDTRLRWVNNQIERDIQSAADLTDIEASRLLDALEQLPPVADAPAEPMLGQQTIDAE